MNKLIITALLCTLASAACAQTVTITNETGDQASVQKTTAVESAKAQSLRDCVMYTGSRITARHNEKAKKQGNPDRQCAPAFGRVYTREDIDRTGYTNIADALRNLDPAMR